MMTMLCVCLIQKYTFFLNAAASALKVNVMENGLSEEKRGGEVCSIHERLNEIESEWDLFEFWFGSLTFF